MNLKTTRLQNHRFTRPRYILAALLLAILATLAGCDGSDYSHDEFSDYDDGYDDGFALDEEYYLGYDDSWFTIGFTPIYYQGGDIPFIPDFSYDAGYYDGIFDAYNDGYFVAYNYAFIIGFSEGYDNAYWPDYLTFLANDTHTDYLNGGFSDGYNDGFSEGRVFGGFDYEVFLPFDWLDAFLDWESGTDLYFEEIDVGTGEFGPESGPESNPESDPSPRQMAGVVRRTARGAEAQAEGAVQAPARNAASPGSPSAPSRAEAGQTPVTATCQRRSHSVSPATSGRSGSQAPGSRQIRAVVSPAESAPDRIRQPDSVVAAPRPEEIRSQTSHSARKRGR